MAALTRTTRGELDRLHPLVKRSELKCKEAIGERVGTVLGRRQVGNHFEAKLSDEGFRLAIDSAAIVVEATGSLRRKLEGVRRRIERGSSTARLPSGSGSARSSTSTRWPSASSSTSATMASTSASTRTRSLPKPPSMACTWCARLCPRNAWMARKRCGATKRYRKSRARFRSFKTIDLKVRPIHHRTEDRVRAHIFLCMLAYYVQYHMIVEAVAVRWRGPGRQGVSRPGRSRPALTGAMNKAATKRLPDASLVHSFHTLLDELQPSSATPAAAAAQRTTSPPSPCSPRPAPKQGRAHDLLDAIAS